MFWHVSWKTSEKHENEKTKQRDHWGGDFCILVLHSDWIWALRPFPAASTTHQGRAWVETTRASGCSNLGVSIIGMQGETLAKYTFWKPRYIPSVASTVQIFRQREKKKVDFSGNSRWRLRVRRFSSLLPSIFLEEKSQHLLDAGKISASLSWFCSFAG